MPLHPITDLAEQQRVQRDALPTYHDEQCYKIHIQANYPCKIGMLIHNYKDETS